MTDTSLPFAEKKFTEVKGHRMAYIDEGEGAPIVFQHGNPTSSYLWRNVMPACRGLGRLIACDLIGMGDSDKLYPSGPDRYTYAEQRDFLFALWDKLGLGNDVVFVVHGRSHRPRGVGPERCAVAQVCLVMSGRSRPRWKKAGKTIRLPSSERSEGTIACGGSDVRPSVKGRQAFAS
jgi:pimeloyl-ACP methyl ester carboxylesterase